MVFRNVCQSPDGVIKKKALHNEPHPHPTPPTSTPVSAINFGHQRSNKFGSATMDSKPYSKFERVWAKAAEFVLTFSDLRKFLIVKMHCIPKTTSRNYAVCGCLPKTQIDSVSCNKNYTMQANSAACTIWQSGIHP